MGLLFTGSPCMDSYILPCAVWISSWLVPWHSQSDTPCHHHKLLRCPCL